MQSGVAYKFKTVALNFNGAGSFSSEVTYFSCLPPQDILPPQYVHSDETTLTITWSEPKILNGCPLQRFDLHINDGLSTTVEQVDPHVNSITITGAVSTIYTVYVEAITAGGVVASGTN